MSLKTKTLRLFKVREIIAHSIVGFKTAVAIYDHEPSTDYHNRIASRYNLGFNDLEQRFICATHLFFSMMQAALHVYMTYEDAWADYSQIIFFNFTSKLQTENYCSLLGRRHRLKAMKISCVYEYVVDCRLQRLTTLLQKKMVVLSIQILFYRCQVRLIDADFYLHKEQFGPPINSRDYSSDLKQFTYEGI